MNESRAGVWIKQGTGRAAFQAFVPKPLPPDPPLVIDQELVAKLEAASRALGQLDGIGRLLRGPEELLHSYVRKEAVLSSQIEGTQSSLKRQDFEILVPRCSACRAADGPLIPDHVKTCSERP